MNIRSKLNLMIIPIIIIPLILIAFLSSETAKRGINEIAKELLSNKLEEFYKNVQSQYNLITNYNAFDDEVLLKKSLEDIKRYAESMDISETGYAQVVTEEGVLLVSPKDEGKNIKETNFYEALSEINNGWVQYNYNGENRVAMVIFFAGWNYFLVVSENQKKFYAEANNISKIIAIIGILTLIVVIFILSYLTKSFTSPLGKLKETMNKIMESNDLNNKAEVMYRDEVGELAVSFNLMTGALGNATNEVKNYAYKAIVARDNEKNVRTVFQKYVPKEVVEEMLQIKKSKSSLLIGKNQECSILFSDIRDFTTISESLGPDELVKGLNVYLNLMVKRIINNNGIIDKFIGDAIMAVFGAPVTTPNDPLNSVKAAFGMFEALEEFNKIRRQEGKIEFHIGAGISSGKVIAGNIGSEDKMDYTVIGDPVNTASRLEGLTKQYKVPIIISESTYQNVKDKIITRELDLIKPKGKTIPIGIYEPIQNPTDLKERAIEFYLKGLAEYKKQHWDEAIQFFKQAYTVNEDKTSMMYIQRCKNYKKTPPGDDWDGVYVFTHK